MSSTGERTLELMNGTEFASLVRTGWLNIRTNETVINELNVFPVPDGDTGSNMRITVENGVMTADSTDDLGVYASRLARGMLLGARGNSGVIFSQIFKGIAQALKGKKTADVREMADALVRGYEAAYHAVVVPTEGTMLTVAREGIENILGEITDDMTMDELFRRYLNEMKRTLIRTPDMLDVLKEAGVVDSGGMGLVSFFEGFVRKEQKQESGRIHLAEHTDGHCIFAREGETGYCVEYVLKPDSEGMGRDILSLTNYMENNGRHVIVRNEDGAYRAHVHVDDPIKLLRTAMEYGEFISIMLDNMQINYTEDGRFLVRHQAPKRVHKPIAYVAVAQGDGIIRALEELGCDVVIDGGQMMNTSVEEFLQAFSDLSADDIIVMPNNSNIRLAAMQAKDMSDMHDHIHVLNTKSVAEGYFAMSMSVAKADIRTQIENLETGADVAGNENLRIADCELIDDSPIKVEGAEDSGEIANVAQINSDGEYIYWSYIAPASDDQSIRNSVALDPNNPLHKSGIKCLPAKANEDGSMPTTISFAVEGVEAYGVCGATYVEPGPQPVEKPGDVNGDGEVNIADVNAVIDHILSNTFSKPADVNGDGEVNIADVNALLDIILAK